MKNSEQGANCNKEWTTLTFVHQDFYLIQDTLEEISRHFDQCTQQPKDTEDNGLDELPIFTHHVFSTRQRIHTRMVEKIDLPFSRHGVVSQLQNSPPQ